MLTTHCSAFCYQPGLSRVMRKASPSAEAQSLHFHISNHSYFQGRQVTRSAMQDITERMEATKSANEKTDHPLQVTKQTHTLLAALEGAWVGRLHTPLSHEELLLPHSLGVPEFPQTAVQRRTRFSSCSRCR